MLSFNQSTEVYVVLKAEPFCCHYAYCVVITGSLSVSVSVSLFLMLLMLDMHQRATELF